MGLLLKGLLPYSAAWAFSRGFNNFSLMYGGGVLSVFISGGALAMQLTGRGEATRIILDGGSVYNFFFLLINRAIALDEHTKNGPDGAAFAILASALLLGALNVLSAARREKNASSFDSANNIVKHTYDNIIKYFAEHPNLRIATFVLTKYLGLVGSINTLSEGLDATTSTAVIPPEGMLIRFGIATALPLLALPSIVASEKATENLNELSKFHKTTLTLTDAVVPVSYISYSLAIAVALVDKSMTWAAVMPLVFTLLFTLMATLTDQTDAEKEGGNSREYELLNS